MPELRVRVLAQQDWPVYRAVRLAALLESPGVLGRTHDQEAAADETFWRGQLTCARRVVAELDGRPCGVVSVGQFSEEPEAAELFDLWVDPTARSTGTAGRLVDTAVALAAADGVQQIYCWAGTENGQAIGFATGFGFRVTSHRRVVDRGDSTVGDTEIALVLPLEDDPNTVPNATTGSALHR
jgi:ribosomal protein S18 acetylase RimI-like enzyme